MENMQNEGCRASKKRSGWAGTILRRSLLVFFTVIVLAVIGLYLVCNLIFNGPSQSARDRITMSMLESSGTKWIPEIFIGKDAVQEIQTNASATLPHDDSTPGEVIIQQGASLKNNGWEDHPDGIRIEYVSGDTYNAYVMLIRDPSSVYLATSTGKFSTDIPGARITDGIVAQGAIAAINAGAFLDNGTTSSVVGSVPEGLVIANGIVVWDSGNAPQAGFVGFNEDSIMVVAETMTAEKAKELSIRDGCGFGPVLIADGLVNEDAYNTDSGLNARTAIGQCADGTVIFLCIDGVQAGSLGGSYADIIDIMQEYKAVNACNLNGGSSSVMLYKDTCGKLGAPDDILMINNYSLLQREPSRMPTFFMVRPNSEE